MAAKLERLAEQAQRSKSDVIRLLICSSRTPRRTT
ncbi:MAG: ribbon-helix-helix protein, CopG family [Chloroflexi bacterium]|nr:ribbon-helix-helix protein, CopG family [Chloroflexota bacterium]